MTSTKPKIALTMGDPTGIGPEIIIRALLRLKENRLCEPVLIGNAAVFQNAAKFIGLDIQFVESDQPAVTNPKSNTWTCLNPDKTTPLTKTNLAKTNLANLPLGVPNGEAGKAAYNCLVAAIELARNGKIDAITTAPLHKKALHLGGIDQPGHTEILAEKCGIDQFAMMLYLPTGERVSNRNGLSIAHVTLHTSIKSVPKLLTQKGVEEKIELLNSFLKKIDCTTPRIGVCALNPHAGEEGLFGKEEANIIQPAVQKMEATGINVAGPFPADTLIKRAICDSEFDGIVAIYHDQGHIPVKLLGFHQAVNITLGLPIIRTSPSHGTAFDKVGKIPADETGIWEAIRIAAQLAKQ